MAIDSVASTGLQGMLHSQQRMTKAASEIAHLSVETANASASTAPNEQQSVRDHVEPMLELKQQQHVFDASAKVVSVADEALGALLDTRA